MFTPETKATIYEVATAIAPDLESSYARNAESIAEVAMDADRLTLIGHSQEAQDEVSALIKEHGYDAVLKAAAKFVPTA